MPIIDTNILQNIEIRKTMDAVDMKEGYVGGAVLVADELDGQNQICTYDCVKSAQRLFIKNCMTMAFMHGDVKYLKKYLSGKKGVYEYMTENGKSIVGIDFEELEGSLKKRQLDIRKNLDKDDLEISDIQEIGVVVDCFFLSEELVNLIKNDKLKAGTFYLGTEVLDETVLEEIKNKKILSYSIAGKALGEEIQDEKESR